MVNYLSVNLLTDDDSTTAAHYSYVRNIREDVTGGEIESLKCIYGETRNSHTMFGFPKF